MKNKEYWITWAKAAGVRAAKTFFQAGVSMIGTATFMGEVNWPAIASASLLAAIVSIGTSVAGIPEVPVPEKKED